MNNSNEISNLDFPVNHIIRASLKDLSEEHRKSVLYKMTEDEFISHRVDVYLQSLETAMHNGYDEAGAKEIALTECLAGMREADE
ncbi:MAG TPA: hypothetical protein PLV21_03940 [Cyclobacteriaceae bacterium]|nr:hypothetical protein [Cyclobacteriaceae bacterium]HRJ81011.1 hypothetical protein [Cyclobacteriaceae bacterium]